jgi:hypothetical protein
MIFRHPTPQIRGVKRTWTRWGEQLRGASVQPPPLKKSCWNQLNRRLVPANHERKRGGQSPLRLLEPWSQ